MAVQARYVFRQSMRDLLASGPTQRQVHTRLLSLLRLHDELVRFVDWPALHVSFQQDIDKLRAMSGGAP